MNMTRRMLLILSLVALVSNCKTVTTTVPVPAGSSEFIQATPKSTSLSESSLKNWIHLDLVQDSIPGLSTNLAYEFLEGRDSQEVIVAVLDSGIDIDHEDLKDNIWVNTDEIPNNGKDDDGNGFIDDVNGWNFLGNVYKENAELYRILQDSTIADPLVYQRAKRDYQFNLSEATKNKGFYGQILQGVLYANTNLTRKLNKQRVAKKDLESLRKSGSMGRSILIADQMFEIGYKTLDEAIQELTTLVKDSNALISGEVLRVN